MSYVCAWCRRFRDTSYRDQEYFTDDMVPGWFCSEECRDNAVRREKRNSTPHIIYKDNSAEIESMKAQLQSSNEQSQMIIETLKAQNEDLRERLYQNYGVCTNCGKLIESPIHEKLGNNKFCCKACFLKFQKDFPKEFHDMEVEAEIQRKNEERQLQLILEDQRLREKEKAERDAVYNRRKEIINTMTEKIKQNLETNPIPVLMNAKKVAIVEKINYIEVNRKFLKKEYEKKIKSSLIYYHQLYVKKIENCCYSYELEPLINSSINNGYSDEQFTLSVKEAIIEDLKNKSSKAPVDFCDLMTLKKRQYNPNLITDHTLYQRWHKNGKAEALMMFYGPKEDGVDGSYYCGFCNTDEDAEYFNNTYYSLVQMYTNGTDGNISSQDFKIKNLNASWDSSSRKITFSFDELTNFSCRATGSLKIQLYFCKTKYNGGKIDGTLLGEYDIPIKRKILYPGEGWKNEKWETYFTGNLPTSGDYYPTIVIIEHQNGKWYITGKNGVTVFNQKNFGNTQPKPAAQPIKTVEKSNAPAAAPAVSKYRQMVNNKENDKPQKTPEPPVSKYRQMMSGKK